MGRDGGVAQDETRDPILGPVHRSLLFFFSFWPLASSLTKRTDPGQGNEFRLIEWVEDCEIWMAGNLPVKMLKNNNG